MVQSSRARRARSAAVQGGIIHTLKIYEASLGRSGISASIHDRGPLQLQILIRTFDRQQLTGIACLRPAMWTIKTKIGVRNRTRHIESLILLDIKHDLCTTNKIAAYFMIYHTHCHRILFFSISSLLRSTPYDTISTSQSNMGTTLLLPLLMSRSVWTRDQYHSIQTKRPIFDLIITLNKLSPCLAP